MPLDAGRGRAVSAVAAQAGETKPFQAKETGAILQAVGTAGGADQYQPVQRRATTGLEIGFAPHPGRIVRRTRGRKACPEMAVLYARRVLFDPGRLVTPLMPLLRLVEPERAHGMALEALRLGLGGQDHSRDPAALEVKCLGLSFSNPIGLAAGFDKNARAILPLMRLGFGYVEAGTVTPRPQAGNPRPRLFRLPEHRAVINRLGFNNAGLNAYVRSISTLSGRPARLGANVGINKDGADPVADYPALVAAVSAHVDYVTINVSSPNTPGLRDLQSEQRLRAILRAIADTVPVRPPLLIKLAPDLSDDGLRAVVDAAMECGAEGLVISNTTIARPAFLDGRNARQAGGLSGAPLFARSTAMLRLARRMAGKQLVLIGCGGIRTGADVLAKLQAGASLVQLYTEFAYVGPALVPRLKRELLEALDGAGFAGVTDAIGTAP